MNLLKTPHQKLMEEAGASLLPSPGMLMTPKQFLFEDSGVLPKFAEGGQIQMTPEQMRAMMMAYGHDIQHFGIGGTVANALMQHAPNAAIAGYFMAPEIKEAYENLNKPKPENPKDTIAGLANSAASMVNLPYWLLSSILGPSSLGKDDTPLTSYYENKK